MASSRQRSQSAAAQRQWRQEGAREREANDLARVIVEEYRSNLRMEVVAKAEQLRRELARNPHSRIMAADAIDRLEKHVIGLVPPPPTWARRFREEGGRT